MPINTGTQSKKVKLKSEALNNSPSEQTKGIWTDYFLNGKRPSEDFFANKADPNMHEELSHDPI
jgi:hypothetical protein